MVFMAALSPFARTTPEDRDAQRRVKELVRARFRLGEDDAIMVAQVACASPGCPPLETIVAFWTGEAKRRHFKVFKPVAEVVEDDLPPWWMKDALVEEEMFGCPCC